MAYVGFNVVKLHHVNTITQGSHSDWKSWKNEKPFPVREKSGNFDQTGKVRENQTKYWKNENISDKYYLLFSVIF